MAEQIVTSAFPLDLMDRISDDLDTAIATVDLIGLSHLSPRLQPADETLPAAAQATCRMLREVRDRIQSVFESVQQRSQNHDY